MKRTPDFAGKIISSGVMGILLFIASLILYSIFIPSDPRHDVPEGFAAGFFMFLAAAFSMFLAGALAMFLTFDNVSSFRHALAIPILAGLVAAAVPLLVVILLGLFAFGLFIIGLIAIVICLLIAESGGLIVYGILSLMRARKKRSVESQ